MALDDSDQALLTKAFKEALAATPTTTSDGVYGMLNDIKTAIAAIPAGGGGANDPFVGPPSIVTGKQCLI